MIKMIKYIRRGILGSVIAGLVLAGAAGVDVKAQGPFSGQIQAALRVFLTTAHTWTGVQTFSGGTVFTGVVKLPDGSASAPSLTFANEPTFGFRRRTASTLDMLSASAGSIRFDLSGSTPSVNFGNGMIGFAAGAPETNAIDAIISRDAPNTVAQRNGTNGQSFRLYNTFTDVNNGEWLALDALNGAVQRINYGNANGTGVARGLRIDLAGTGLWLFNTSGNLVDQGTHTITAGSTISGTGYQISGNAFGTGTVGPSSPVGTTSTAALVMAGLGGSITTRTGRVEICASGNLTDNTANDGTKAQISYGTGTAPTNGAALTGTQVGTIFQYSASTLAAGATAPYGGCVVVTGLTLNTAYWLDMAFAAITGGTGSLTSAYMAAHDIP